MHENQGTHELLAQVPLMVSPFISLPVAAILPSTYKKLPSTIPSFSTGILTDRTDNKYVISKSGHAAHPDEIQASCEALRNYVQKIKADADEEIKAWEREVAARELAEKRRIAPGWLDSDARILHPEKPRMDGNLIDSQIDFSNVDASVTQIIHPEVLDREGDELDLMPTQVSRGVFVKNLSSHLGNLRNYYKVCPSCSALAWTESHSPFAKRRRGPATHNVYPVSTKFLSDLKTPRAQLIRSLKELNKHAPSYISQSRLQLALRGLEQKCGEETIRIAVLCITGEKSSFHTAKKLIQLLLADPLKPKELWEQILLSEGPQAILLKLDPETSLGALKDNNLVQELHVSSPLLNGHRAEVLIMESNLPSDKWKEEISSEAFLVPTVKIQSSSTGRFNVVRTPVHRTLLISEGLLGAINLLKVSMNFNHQDTVETAIDLNVSDDHKSSVPSQSINVALATKALERVRQNSTNLPEYETSWSLSGLPKIQSWLQQGITSVDAGMKLYLQKLIESLLEDTSRAIQDDQCKLLAEENSKKASRNDIAKLRQELQNWASRSHSELQDNLELAFKGQRWHRLSWWKLFWRVDDISLIASDILNQNFLINSEQEAIFLAGRIEERGMINRQIQTPSEPHISEHINKEVSNVRMEDEPAPPKRKEFMSCLTDNSILQSKNKSWPLHISVARLYLSHFTIPSLQALGQKIVIQTLCTSSLCTMLSGLVFFSSVSLDLYEVGVVATIGILFSLRRMQRIWEKARDKWEGEVREEGRIALRAVEEIFNVLLKTKPSVPEFEEIKNAEAALMAAQKALRACKLK
ncbi:hypothetical protein EPUL_000166, partial [Erysiphe pulchra]